MDQFQKSQELFIHPSNLSKFVRNVWYSVSKNTAPAYFLNSSMKNQPILIIFGMRHAEETWLGKFFIFQLHKLLPRYLLYNKLVKNGRLFHGVIQKRGDAFNTL